MLVQGALVVDLRSPRAFAANHIPGSLSIPAGSSFGTWLGWVVDLDRPVVLLLPEHRSAPGGLNLEAWDDALRQALRIGQESVAGYLDGGLAAWVGAGLPTESNGRLTVPELAEVVDRGGPDAPIVLDVRQLSEYEEGHVAGAWLIGAGDLPGRLADLPRDRAIAAVCGAGYRASVAASLLDAAGFSNVSWVAGGMDAWLAEGYPVDRGTDAKGANELPTAVPPGHRHG
jgi:hydroxyacylglutathione hydrolase